MTEEMQDGVLQTLSDAAAVFKWLLGE